MSYTKTTSVSIRMLSHTEVITFKMTVTRSKRIAEEFFELCECHNVGNSLDIERFEEVPNTITPVNFVENGFRNQYLRVHSIMREIV